MAGTILAPEFSVVMGFVDGVDAPPDGIPMGFVMLLTCPSCTHSHLS